jgi:threonine/homoserine/homoserine lactone efflux protein
MNPYLQAAAPLASFLLVMSITPGPNNLMLMSSGARFGLRRTLAHMVGVFLGFFVILGVTYAGVGAVLLAYPRVEDALTVGCALYLLWLCYQILRAGRPAEDVGLPIAGGNARPLLAREAALFQLINPKAWGAAVPACGILAKQHLGPVTSVALLFAVNAVISLACIWIWTGFGAALRPLLGVTWIRHVFNATMAVLVAATACWMLWPLLQAR